MNFAVTIKNISANVDKMTIPQGDTTTIIIKADEKSEGIGKAFRKAFNGCGFHSEGQYGTDGTLIGTVCHGRNQYGRAWVYVAE